MQKQPFLVQRLVLFAGWLWRFYKQELSKRRLLQLLIFLVEEGDFMKASFRSNLLDTFFIRGRLTVVGFLNESFRG